MQINALSSGTNQPRGDSTNHDNLPRAHCPPIPTPVNPLPPAQITNPLGRNRDSQPGDPVEVRLLFVSSTATCTCLAGVKLKWAEPRYVTTECDSARVRRLGRQRAHSELPARIRSHSILGAAGGFATGAGRRRATVGRRNVAAPADPEQDPVLCGK